MSNLHCEEQPVKGRVSRARLLAQQPVAPVPRPPAYPPPPTFPRQPTIPPPTLTQDNIAGDSADAGGSAMMVDASTSTDAWESAHPAGSADSWTLQHMLASMVHLAGSVMPAMGSVLNLNPFMMLNPHMTQEGESWTGLVSESLEMFTAICSLPSIEDKLRNGRVYHNLMSALSNLAMRLASMRALYEYLATMCDLAQKHANLFSDGGALYWPNDTLNSGYTQARLRRIIVSHRDFMEWILELLKQEDLFELAMQEDTTPIMHSRLK